MSARQLQIATYPQVTSAVDVSWRGACFEICPELGNSDLNLLHWATVNCR